MTDTCKTTGVPTKFCMCVNCNACPHCKGTKLTTIRGMCGGVEMDCDEQPCGFCADEEPTQPDGCLANNGEK